MEKQCISQFSENLNDGEYINLLQNIDVKKNKTLTFTAKINEFVSLRIGHGEKVYGGSFIDVDKDEIKVYNYTLDAALSKSEPHGLLIKDFVTVVINVGLRAEITVFTNGGYYTMSAGWSGCNGMIFAKSIGSKLFDCEIKWTCSDILRPLWVFGDSYLALTTPIRFPYYVLKLGFDNWLACGYPGAAASSQILCFENLLKFGKPRYAVWCLGMNNNDINGLNLKWLDSTEKFLSLCSENNITPILSTVPTTWHKNDDGTLSVVRENRPKNEWVKNSGHRFVDFEKAVGADGGNGWYEGTLCADDVHPTEQGAQALAARFITDIPEIALKN